MDYYPYGKILREYSNGEQEKYLTTQHERDVETGLDYRGARFYDGDLGRFLSLDPLAADFAEWSAYNYVLGNPVMFIDPDGKEPQDIIVGEDQNFVLENLHARTKARYTFNENNELIRDKSVKQEVDAYSDKIDEAIASPNKIEIKKQTDIASPQYGGLEVSIDIMYGGGVTRTSMTTYVEEGKERIGEQAVIFITGNPNSKILDKEGKTLEMTSADILLHELIGHALGFITSTGSGNAIVNENEVRKKLGLKERKDEENHRQ